WCNSAICHMKRAYYRGSKGVAIPRKYRSFCAVLFFSARDKITWERQQPGEPPVNRETAEFGKGNGSLLALHWRLSPLHGCSILKIVACLSVCLYSVPYWY